MSFLRKRDQNGHIQADFGVCFRGIVREKLGFRDFLFDNLVLWIIIVMSLSYTLI